MKHYLAAIIAACALAACGGGGGGSTPVPPGATPTPAPVVTKSVVWTTSFLAKATSSHARAALAVGSPEPITIAAPLSANGQDAASAYGETTGYVSAVEKDSLGNVVSTTATYSTQSATVATVSTPTPQPSSTPVALVNAVALGATATVAQFADGVSSTYPVNVITSMQLYSPPNGNAWPGQQAYYINASGAITPTTSKAQADVYIEGTKGSGDFAASAWHLVAPLGYKELGSSTSIATVSSVGFTPTGTSFDLTSPSSPSGYPGLWLVKSQQSGRFMAIRFASFAISGTTGALAAYFADAEACASDAVGVFTNC